MPVGAEAVLNRANFSRGSGSCVWAESPFGSLKPQPHVVGDPLTVPLEQRLSRSQTADRYALR